MYIKDYFPNLTLYLSLCVRKPTICMGENKDADQLRGNREADQRLCFRYTDSTFSPLLIPKFSRFWVSSVTVQAGLCWTWSETQIVGFLMHRLISICSNIGLPSISYTMLYASLYFPLMETNSVVPLDSARLILIYASFKCDKILY